MIIRHTQLQVMLLLMLIFGPVTLGAKALPEGTRILVMVVEPVPRTSIMETGKQGMLGRLRAEGISDEMISDGSIAVGIIYCCGGNISKETALVFYVAPEFRTQVGDVVEIQLGRIASKKELKRGEFGSINRAVTVRESFEDDEGLCRWDPPNDTLWMRILYCDWMLGEGWQRRGGLNPGWYRN